MNETKGYHRFRCILLLASTEELKQAIMLHYNFLLEETDRGCAVGTFVGKWDGPTELFVTEDKYGDPEQGVRFILRCAKVFKLAGKVTLRAERLDTKNAGLGLGFKTWVIDLNAATIESGPTSSVNNTREENDRSTP